MMRHQQLSLGKLLLTAVVGCAFVAASPLCLAQSFGADKVEVRVVADEAEAVLAILAKKKSDQPVTEADWRHLFSTEGYVRLKQREKSMQRAFEDQKFKTFVLSDQLSERAGVLEETLARWKRAEANGAARRALAYLPRGTRLRAKIYPVIKPRENSFVFDVSGDPAIFLYLNPKVSTEKFENTLAHELHHIGYAASCLPALEKKFDHLPENARTVLYSIGSFGEGIAMLAAAGSPDVHPHAVSDPEERARWDADMMRFNEDLKRVEKFFQDVLDKRLSGEEIQRVNSSFFGIQGPWYTVGWKMAIVIEKTYGRAKLVECLCDPVKLLSTYNRAAAKYGRTTRQPLALWSPLLLKKINAVGR